MLAVADDFGVEQLGSKYSVTDDVSDAVPLKDGVNVAPLTPGDSDVKVKVGAVTS